MLTVRATRSSAALNLSGSPPGVRLKTTLYSSLLLGCIAAWGNAAVLPKPWIVGYTHSVSAADARVTEAATARPSRVARTDAGMILLMMSDSFFSLLMKDSQPRDVTRGSAGTLLQRR